MVRSAASLALGAVALTALAAPAAAQRPSTLGMSCAGAQRLVAQSGAIVLSTGRHTYDRFVAHPGYCATSEYAYTGTAPTADAGQCVLGYVCKSAPPLFVDPGEDDFPFFNR